MKQEQNDCPCKRLKCARHGNCDACLAHHRVPGSKYAAACERINAKKEKQGRK